MGETVSVTGSHIRTTGFQAMSPVQVTRAPSHRKLGTRELQRRLQGDPWQLRIGSGHRGSLPRYGQSQFNLRGLGYSSTLTLINGRRAAIAPVSDDSGAEYTDVNQFPLAMVERVEVLKDGASAIYGADAVAGVVNVITRRAFKGMELSGGYQSATNQGGLAQSRDRPPVRRAATSISTPRTTRRRATIAPTSTGSSSASAATAYSDDRSC